MKNKLMNYVTFLFEIVSVIILTFIIYTNFDKILEVIPKVFNFENILFIILAIILFISLVLTIYSKDKLGLNPNEYTQKDIYKR